MDLPTDRTGPSMNPLYRYRKLSVSIAVLIIGMMAISPAQAVSQSTWHVQVGAGSSDMARWGLAFYPNSITVHPGDNVQFTNNLGEPHTVTFGAPSDLFLNFFQYFGPYGGSILTGAAGQQLNSGILGAGFPFGTSFNLTVNAPPGEYGFRCALHPLMSGSITVIPSGEDLPKTAKQYAREARVSIRQDLAVARQIQAQTKLAAKLASDLGGKGIEVAAGGGDGTSAVFRFFKGHLTITAGETVTFVNRDFFTPHTVTFGEEPPGAPESLVQPYGDPSHFNGTTPLNSGFLFTPFQVTRFSITFTTPGEFHYICGLHDQLGMVGSVTVLPADDD